MTILDWEIMKNGMELIKDKKLVFYGASSTSLRMYRLIKTLDMTEQLVAIVDSDKNKIGKKWNHLYISDSHDIEQYIREDVVIVITSVYVKEIYADLEKHSKIGGAVVGSLSLWLGIHYDIMNGRNKIISEKVQSEYREKYNIYKLLDSDTVGQLRENFRSNLLHICKCDSPVFLHSIPKTGNKTLIKSFEHVSNVITTGHAFCYDDDSKEKVKRVVECVGENDIRLISGVRYPIERTYSSWWQRAEKPYLSDEEHISTLVNRHYMDQKQWFDEQVKEIFGIDVFSYPFDKERGYTIIDEGRVKIFLYRLDFLNKLENEIGEFVGVENFKLQNDNVADGKKYTLAYSEYKKEIRVDKKFFNSVVESPEMTHFFTEEEVCQYVEKWKEYLI